MNQRKISLAMLLLLLSGTATAVPQSVNVRGWDVAFDTISPVIIELSTLSADDLEADQISVKDADDPSKVVSISLGHFASSRMATPETLCNTAEAGLSAYASQLGIVDSAITSKPYIIDGKEGAIAYAYAAGIKRDVYEAMYPLDLVGQEANWMVSFFSFFDEASTYHILDSLRITRI